MKTFDKLHAQYQRCIALHYVVYFESFKRHLRGEVTVRQALARQAVLRKRFDSLHRAFKRELLAIALD